MSDLLLAPKERANQVALEDVERDLRFAMRDGVLSHGWIIAGPKGAGKATLAYRIARGLLDPSALIDEKSFNVQDTAHVFRLVTNDAHPDLFVAERRWNEKNSRYQSEITIETIRALTLFLNRTAALGGFRVAIIDSADELNRNAANALLKALEEPPRKTLLLVLAQSPGRLLATIRSRCRKIALRPAPHNAIIELLKLESGCDDAAANSIATASNGRPGFALTLATDDGIEAVALADRFLSEVAAGQCDPIRIAPSLTGKYADAKWELFCQLMSDRLQTAARKAGRGETPSEPLAAFHADILLRAWEKLSVLANRGAALNLDRGQLVHSMSFDLQSEFRNA